MKQSKVKKDFSDGSLKYTSELETFIINSCHLSSGRSAIIEAEDDTFLFGSYLGKANINLDRIITN